jgi:hypothetical protein
MPGDSKLTKPQWPYGHVCLRIRGASKGNGQHPCEHSWARRCKRSNTAHPWSRNAHSDSKVPACCLCVRRALQSTMQ